MSFALDRSAPAPASVVEIPVGTAFQVGAMSNRQPRFHFGRKSDAGIVHTQRLADTGPTMVS